MLKLQLRKAEEILKSKSSSLRDLAQLSGLPILRFYNGADLQGLDLIGENLKGLNFDRADLRGSRVKGAIFDRGAFNGSILDASEVSVKDSYEFYADDVYSFLDNELLLFCRIRSPVVDTLVAFKKMSFRDFSNDSGVSENALRKARLSQVIAIDTARRVLRYGLDGFEKSSEHLQPFASMLDQPYVEFLEGGNNKPFFPVSRSELSSLTRYRRLRIERGGDPSVRDTPEWLRFLHKHDHLRIEDSDTTSFNSDDPSDC